MARSGLGDERRPVGSFLFSGPTGVGKTEVTRQLAMTMGVELIRFDMSEYMERHTVSRLIGAPPGYVGFDQGGLLTEAITKHPHCVLLFDEIEKAHPEVFNLLLQVMDHGTLTDNNGRKADFRNVTIVMTTNAGAQESSRASVGFTTQDHSTDAMEVLKKLFSPEFRNRLDAIIQFEALDELSVARVVDKLIVELETQLDKNGVDDRARSRGARLDRKARLRQEDGRAADGARDPGAHQAAARRRALVRQARRRRPRARRGRGGWRRRSCSRASPKSASSSTCPRAHSTESKRTALPQASARSARAIGDPALGEVVGRELDRHGVALQDPDVMFAHLPRDVRGDDMAVRELDAKRRVRQRLHYRTFHLYRFFFGHSARVAARFGRGIVAYRAQRRQTSFPHEVTSMSRRNFATGLRIPALRVARWLAISSSRARKSARGTAVAPRLATCAEAT